MSHYATCPGLFAILLEIFPSASPFPLTRLGLVTPSRDSLLMVSCVRRYFALSCNQNFKTLLDQHQLLAARSSFSDAFLAEAIDCGLSCRHLRIRNNSSDIGAVASAPGGLPSRAPTSTFVPSSEANAHNPLLACATEPDRPTTQDRRENLCHLHGHGESGINSPLYLAYTIEDCQRAQGARLYSPGQR